MSARIDLHIHTTYSDGLTSPAHVLDIVRKKGLEAFSICDHDNLGGYFETRKLMMEGDPELVPGVELSAGRSGEDIHILGYYFDPDSKILVEALRRFREIRNRRGARMLQELKKMGIDISMELIEEIAGNSAIGRPHIADAMLRVSAINRYEDAFNRYIGLNGPAYVPKANLTPKEAIELIHGAGGLAFLAHPRIANAARFIDEFIDYGLDGIEIYHPYQHAGHRKTLSKIAKSKSILACGGSDYHGREDRYGMIGSQPVPPELLSEMKKN